MLPALWNLSEKGFDYWSFHNTLEHNRIVQAVQVEFGIFLNTYPIYPVNVKELLTFLNWHQQMHNDFNDILGLPGNDLTSLDFQDQTEVDTWALLHVQEHIAASNKLGLT
jgi:hypothetical protein